MVLCSLLYRFIVCTVYTVSVVGIPNPVGIKLWLSFTVLTLRMLKWHRGMEHKDWLHKGHSKSLFLAHLPLPCWCPRSHSNHLTNTIPKVKSTNFYFFLRLNSYFQFCQIIMLRSFSWGCIIIKNKLFWWYFIGISSS